MHLRSFMCVSDIFTLVIITLKIKSNIKYIYYKNESISQKILDKCDSNRTQIRYDYKINKKGNQKIKHSQYGFKIHKL